VPLHQRGELERGVLVPVDDQARTAVVGMRRALSPFRSRGSRAAIELDERGGTLLRESA